MKLLKGHTLDGLSNGEIAQALGESAVNISRALAVLVDEGVASRLETGRYAPSIALLQIAQAHADEMARVNNRMSEINQRVMAGALN
jgi:DNA-binding IclR family transcriptional regulator